VCVWSRMRAQDELEQFKELPEEVVLDSEVGALVKTLWADPGVQAAFVDRHRFQLHDSAS
jgi:hypothetical protein